MNRGKKPLGVMERRIPENPRYAHVRSRLDTGLTMDKVKPITAKEFIRRRDEPFFRVSPGQLGELLAEYEQDQQAGIKDIECRDPDNNGPMIVTHTQEETAAYDRPYLILDLRPPEAYAQCKITQARSFPAVLLNQDRMPPEVFRYKNREGNLIILYEDMERIACDAAATLMSRGFDNLYVVTGGLNALIEFHPEYVEGTIPHINSSSSRLSSGGSTTSRMRLSAGGGTDRLSTGGMTGRRGSTGSYHNGSERMSSGPGTPSVLRPKPGYSPDTLGGLNSQMGSMSLKGGHDLRSTRGTGSIRGDSRRLETSSILSDMSVADSVISRATARKGR